MYLENLKQIFKFASLTIPPNSFTKKLIIETSIFSLLHLDKTMKQDFSTDIFNFINYFIVTQSKT
ncbi:hypothetical protein BpHYR1_027055 [Brachionus plicatilis]|uniref:Uncharacterized protein n=1 Tax=Brachionus plicatilis TaxID=10195 RepID=A0A3M7Q7J5_BRAPC|nr:hypothetical protein BpHYR1_027055 [Brachionus plicatilis]